jgi:molybdopterin/thiamine biosynthesis adenylyltransferase
MPEVGRLTLIDSEVYEERNVRNQAITPVAIGLSKAEVQARVAWEIAPWLEITPIHDHVEDVPLGVLNCDLLLTCVDSRRTRQFANQAAFRLLTPWIDAGVLADGLLARVDVFRPGADVPCLECGWAEPEYAALEQRYPCTPITAPARTGGPSALGALAASLQALQCRAQLPLHRPYGTEGSAEQIVIDAGQHRLFHTRHTKNPSCRFCGNHHYPSWCVRPLTLPSSHATLGDLLDQLKHRLLDDSAPTIRVAGRLFSTLRRCLSCGHESGELRLISRDSTRPPPCGRCGAPYVVTGFGVTESIDGGPLPAEARDLTLVELGLRDYDVLSVPFGGDDLHFVFRSTANGRGTRGVRS